MRHDARAHRSFDCYFVSPCFVSPCSVSAMFRPLHRFIHTYSSVHTTSWSWAQPLIGLYFGLRGYIPLLEHLAHPFFFVFIRVDVARNASIHRGSFVSGVQKLCDQECSGVSGLHVEPCDRVLRLLNSALVSSLAPVGPQARAPKSDQPSKEIKGACRSKSHCHHSTTTSNKRCEPGCILVLTQSVASAGEKKKLSDGL